MKENLSALGNLEDWIDASESALWNAGFEEVELDNIFERLSAYYGRSGHISINFMIQNDGRVRLEIEASDREILECFKTAITHEMSRPKQQSYHHAKTIQEDDFDEEDDDYNDSSSKKRRTGKASKENSSLHMPRVPRFSKKKPLLSKTWFILLMLFLIPPFGIFLLFYFKRFKILPRLLITLLAVLYTLLIWLSFFGVDTGVNQESIGEWMATVQSQVTRFIQNTQKAPTTDKTEPTPELNTDTLDKNTTDNSETANPTPSTDNSGNPIKDLINNFIPPTDTIE